jgi:hypothetical protein
MILGTFMCPDAQKTAIQRFPANVQDVETRKRSARPPEFLASTQVSGEKEHWSISDARSARTLGQSNPRTMTIDSRLFAFPYKLQEGIRREYRKARKLKTEAATIEETV